MNSHSRDLHRLVSVIKATADQDFQNKNDVKESPSPTASRESKKHETAWHSVLRCSMSNLSLCKLFGVTSGRYWVK